MTTAADVVVERTVVAVVPADGWWWSHVIVRDDDRATVTARVRVVAWGLLDELEAGSAPFRAVMAMTVGDNGYLIPVGDDPDLRGGWLTHESDIDACGCGQSEAWSDHFCICGGRLRR